MTHGMSRLSTLKKVACNLCNRRFKTQHDLQAHVQNKHLQDWTGQIFWLMSDTVDVSEISFPTTWDGAKTLLIMG